MDEQSLQAKIPNLLERLRRSAEKSQRENSDILLVAVSKTRPASDIRAAHACGLTHFGENYLQEALEKMTELEDLPLVWHFIGPIQSNKAAAIAEHFDWVHSVDRLKIARRLSERRPPDLPPLQLCLQVNISGEQSKSGVSLEELATLAREVTSLPNITLRGLMAIPAPTGEPGEQRAAFARLREALESLQGLDARIDTLSMGMSADMEAAIAEGATMVRIGSAIFGPRNR